jgi:hypothetical protein
MLPPLFTSVLPLMTDWRGYGRWPEHAASWQAGIPPNVVSLPLPLMYTAGWGKVGLFSPSVHLLPAM